MKQEINIKVDFITFYKFYVTALIIMFRKNREDDDLDLGFDLDVDAETPIDTSKVYDDTDWDECIDEYRKKEKKKRKRQPSKKNQIEYEDFYNNEEKKAINPKIIAIIITCIFLYGCFIGVGALLTTYKDGNPQVVDVNLRELRNEYRGMKKDYDDMYLVIQNLNNINNSISGSDIDNVKYASEYKQIIDTINSNTKDVQGKTYPSDYSFMQKINNILYENLRNYCQAMSDGMSTQSTSYIKTAQSYKETYEAQFTKYSSNIEKIKEICELEEQ